MFLRPWAEFQYTLKALQKLFMVSSRIDPEFRATNSAKYSKKEKKLLQRLQNQSEIDQAKDLKLAKLNTCKMLQLYLCNIIGCMPTDPLNTRDLIVRWYVIGR